jgi:hypothetical protein
MSTPIESLLKLYRIDRRLRALRQRLDSAGGHQRSQSAQLEKIDGELNELRTRKRQLQARIAGFEGEAASLDERVEKFRRDMNSAETNKQYTAVLTELNTVKADRTKLDDAILAEMASMEEVETRIVEATARRADRAKLADHAAAQYREREVEVQAQLDQLQAERDAAASEVAPADLALFDSIADDYDGEAMAPVEEIDRRHREFACGACNIQIPFDHVATLMSPTGTIIRCVACHRILYLEETVRGALAPK